MNKIALPSLALGLFALAPSAQAQTVITAPCPNGAMLCASVTITTQPSTAVVVQPAPPPPAYIVQAPPPPPPRVVIVQSPPPPPPPRYIVVEPPRPRVIFHTVQPTRVYIAPQPVVVYQQPQPVYVQQPQPVYVQQPQPMYGPPGYWQPPRRRFHFGLQANVAGAFFGSDTTSTGRMGNGMMAGAGAGLRLRGAGHLGAELSFNVITGRDYNGDSRTEVPLGFTGLLYFNPQNRLQVYGLLGFDFSWANVNYEPNNYWAHGGLNNGQYTYFGGHAGLGLELQVTQHFAIFADVRGFARTRIDGSRETNPEFTRTVTNGSTTTTESTNVSGGVYAGAGLALYF